MSTAIRDYLDPISNEKPYYKIYNDGGHYIATRCYKSLSKIQRSNKSDLDICFDTLYSAYVKEGLYGAALSNQIKTDLLLQFPDIVNLDDYIASALSKKEHNYWSRIKRFKRKAYLNRWNYFVTFTYDDKKQTADSFKRKLRKCLANLHTRRGWLYMGVFESAPDTGRVHFHGLLYVPSGEMIGTLKEVRDFDVIKKQMQAVTINSFFEKKFGRNDFCEVTEMELKYGQRLNYILKYIDKTGERIVYSRGIPTEIIKCLDNNDIITEYKDFVVKYVLFDDILNWEFDIMQARFLKQLSISGSMLYDTSQIA